MALIGGPAEPAERVLIGARYADAGRIERTEVELSFVVTGCSPRIHQIAARPRATGRYYLLWG